MAKMTYIKAITEWYLTNVLARRSQDFEYSVKMLVKTVVFSVTTEWSSR